MNRKYKRWKLSQAKSSLDTKRLSKSQFESEVIIKQATAKDYESFGLRELSPTQKLLAQRKQRALILCHGRTKSGDLCKNRKLKDSMYCSIHQT